MSGLFDDCENHFGTDDLYKVLGVNSKSTEKEIKKAYHRLSLKVHPDRASDDNKVDCTKKFQALGKVYSILSDSEARKVYDETGEIDDDLKLQDDKDWYEYWRILFAKVSVKDIEEFEQKYKGSDEEKQDLKEAYIQGKGCMDYILDNVMCATIDDESRFRKILKTMIKDGEVKSYKAFEKEDKNKKKERKAKAEEEAAEAEQLQKELGLGQGEDSLKQLILKNQQSRQAQANSFFDQLEAKYAAMDQDKPKVKKSKKK